MQHSIRAVILLWACLLIGSAANAQHFPESIDPGCRWGKAKIYDECGSQLALLEKAKASATAQGKIVLVVVGAEWCVWCHSFYQTIHGMSGPTTVYHEGESLEMGELLESRPERAGDIKTFVEKTFVVVSIESQYSPDWPDVLTTTAAPDITGLPFIFTLKNGRMAAVLRWEDELPGIELRSNFAPFYRGFNRAILLSELQRIAEAAR